MHRDIKPANIFLSADGAVKLGDLGLGRAFSEQTFEAVSKVGTPLYMSPEVLDGRGYEWKSDVWSLGVLLYELAALRSPFKADGDNLYMLFQKISKGAFAPIPPNFSNGLRETIRAMLHVEPTRRPDVSSVLAMAKAAAAETAAAAAAAAAAATAEHGGGDGGGGGGGGDTEAGSDVYLVMEAALDKLKLLEYERSAFWKAERARSATGSARDLERSHFAQRASDGRAQFLAFCRCARAAPTPEPTRHTPARSACLFASRGARVHTRPHAQRSAPCAGSVARSERGLSPPPLAQPPRPPPPPARRRLMDWLGTSVCASASDVLRLAPASPSAASFETHALAAATAILELLERLAASLGGAGSEGGARALLRTLSAHKLAVGSGLDVCLALNLALDAALLATRFEWRPARVAEADDDGGAADVAAADGGGGAAGTQLGADWASGSDDDDATASNGAPSAPSASVAPPVYARVSAERWLAEAERLAPALRLAFRAADAARARAGGGSERELRGRALRAELAPWADALETVERLAAARAAEVSAHAASLLPQALTAREAAAALAARAETVEAASSALAERAAELRALEAQLAAVKAALDERSAELDGGGGRLAALKRAVRDVGAETNALGTRLATVQAQLAHRALAALAAAPRASAARGASAAALPRATVGRQPPSLPSPARAAAGYVSHPPAAASGARPTSGRR
jgi:hypothetical protein